MFVGATADTILADLHIRKTEPTIMLNSDASSFSFIDFVETSSTSRAGILYNAGKLVLTSNTNGTTPNVSLTGLALDTSNNFVGIGTTSGIGSQLTLTKDTFIGVNTVDASDDGFLGLVGGGGNTSTGDRGARIELSGNERSGNEGKLLLSGGNASTGGSISLETATVERFKIDYLGNVYMSNTTYSTNSSTGALVLDGGLSIKQSQNATSTTSGGALTVAGGVAIGKNLYVEGNIVASGTVSSGDNIIIPTLVFSNTSNCVVNGYDNQSVILSGTQALFTTTITVTPILGSENTTFEFVIPERTINWVGTTELTSTIQGYTNSGDPIQLYNTTFVAVPGTTRGRVKFQSVDASLHYIDLICRYLAA
jgi:hypothetical protein